MNKLSPPSSTLPPNTTLLERSAVQALGGLEEISVPMKVLVSAANCPREVLPYLAWSNSVDRWDVDWPEQTKRAITADAFFVHQRKGTIGALRRVVAPFGFLLQVKEWWQFNLPKKPGTFHLEIGVLDSGLSEESYSELIRLIEDAKPLSRHLTGLAIITEVKGGVYINLACHDGDAMTIYPPCAVGIDIFIPIAADGYSHLIDTMCISPISSTTS